MLRKNQDPITAFLFSNETVCFIDFVTVITSRQKDHDLLETGHEPLSDDPEEAKLDYWREDSLFHAFHALLHQTWDRLAMDNSPDRFNRTFELFFYAHREMVRR